MYFLPGGVKSLRYSAYHLAVSKMFTVISSLSVDTLGTKHAKKKKASLWHSSFFYVIF